MSSQDLRKAPILSEALEYHARLPHGKVEITATKPCLTQHDLSLAYTPGVAEPCLAIQRDPDLAYEYTDKGNLVAVITNGTAVLGLGNIGPLAAKPVMEGKAVLFKRFADIDAIDIELSTASPDQFVQAVRAMEPSFGAINLEDIRAPECFEIEQTLRRSMRIPVFHDDQHGTAIIVGAALLNALELVGKQLTAVRIVFSGAGAAAVATARFCVELGARAENIVMADIAGVVRPDREPPPDSAQRAFATTRPLRTLAEALADADVLIGLSAGGVVTGDMLRAMAPRPVVFALANPTPEVPYDDARRARPDAIVATGRSDYPNQVNNVLGFPSIFRGALDARATEINEAMKAAAARALARLAREDVPDSVVKAYGVDRLRFGEEYLIPKPLDPRVLFAVAPAVAGAAMESGVARIDLDLEQYRERLEARFGHSRELLHGVFRRARRDPQRIALAAGEHDKMIRAAYHLVHERLARPILVGRNSVIRARAGLLDIPLEGIAIADPDESADAARYSDRLYSLRMRKGVTRTEARELAQVPDYFAALMVDCGDADGMISGLSAHYPDRLRPPLQVIGRAPGTLTAAGVYIVAMRQRVLFFADTAVNIDPDARTLAEIAILTARLAERLSVEPRIALLSFSNFGSVRDPRTEKVQRAVQIVREQAPELKVDGEMQVTTALDASVLMGAYPFNTLGGEANVLIFPSLESGNIGYKLVQRLVSSEVVGPILVGMRKPAHVVQRTDEVKDIVNLAALACAEAQVNVG